MTAKNIIDAHAETVGSLITFSSNKHTIMVPEYQRSYRWDPSRVDDLLKLSDPDNVAFGFIGTMVFVKNSDGKLEVVDGQQRLLSIIVALCAFRDFLKEYLAIAKLDQDVSSMLEEMLMDIQKDQLYDRKSYSNVDGTARIAFKRASYGAFRDSYLLGQQGDWRGDDEIKKELLIFHKNYESAKKYFNQKYPTIGRGTVKLLSMRLEKLMGLMVNTIYITREEYAGEVFESINGTGVNLRLSELVKNYIYRNLSEESARRKWNQIQLNCQNKDEYMEMLIKYDWQSKFDIGDEYEIFRSIRNQITDINVYTDRLLHISNILSFYLDPNQDRFKKLKLKDNANDKNHIVKYAEVLRILDVRQFLRLVFALDTVIEQVSIKDYVKLLELIVNFQVRAKVSKTGSNFVDDMYSSLAKSIHKLSEEKGNDKIDQRIRTELFDRLRSTMQKLNSDEEFEDAFARFSRTKSTKKQLFKYLLAEIENSLQRRELHIDIKNNHITLEEIYPQNPSDDWKGSCSSDDTYRLSNATILADGDNRKATNDVMSKKIEVYKESELKVNQQLVVLAMKGGTSWTSDKIRDRGVTLAEIARGIWRIK